MSQHTSPQPERPRPPQVGGDAAPRGGAAGGAAGRDAQVSDKLAHEMANLLDGSMRNVGLLVSSLRGGQEAGLAEDELLDRLENVDVAMRQMVMLLKRWQQHQHAPGQLYKQVQTLGQTVDRAVNLLAPAARMRRIDVQARIDAPAGLTPGGPVYQVISNALRNAIQAIDLAAERGQQRDWRVTVAAEMVEGKIELSIEDNGPGFDQHMLDEQGQVRTGSTTKATGQGLGLSLCQEIAETLGGTLELGRSSAGGALVRLVYPAPTN